MNVETKLKLMDMLDQLQALNSMIRELKEGGLDAREFLSMVTLYEPEELEHVISEVEKL